MYCKKYHQINKQTKVLDKRNIIQFYVCLYKANNEMNFRWDGIVLKWEDFRGKGTPQLQPLRI